jgi:hypothetical protein
VARVPGLKGLAGEKRYPPAPVDAAGRGNGVRSTGAWLSALISRGAREAIWICLARAGRSGERFLIGETRVRSE